VFRYTHRAPLAGSCDVGDFTNTGIWTVEAKNAKRVELAAWMDEARIEARRVAADQVPVVIFPRRNHPTERAFVVLELADWLRVAAIVEGVPLEEPTR